jgi:hypothetical protein
MSPDYKAKYLTLDWDNISIDEAYARVKYICSNYANVRKLVLSLSPTKGFHVRISLYSNTNVALMRRALKDDGNRLIHDILNRPDNIHDILWSGKTVSGIRWEEKELITLYN